MDLEIEEELKNLEELVSKGEYEKNIKDIKEWGGADVIIKSKLDNQTKKWLENQPFVISFQQIKPQKRAIITKYSKELSWLFYQLRDIFQNRIDYISKYDFYGILAQTAMDYLEKHKYDADCNQLLLSVIAASRRYEQNVIE